MPSFTTTLVSGTKRPYDTWTFVVVPEQVLAALGSKRPQVRGTIQGVDFTGTVSKGEGVYRMPIPRELQDRAKIARGDKVRVLMEADPEPRPIEVPRELQDVLDADAELARRFEGLPPSHRRAWAAFVAEARQAETRVRRAGKARAGIRSKRFPGT